MPLAITSPPATSPPLSPADSCELPSACGIRLQIKSIDVNCEVGNEQSLMIISKTAIAVWKGMYEGHSADLIL